MKVPACPMPIHQTKLTIAKPHATGTLTPQMPMPRANSQAIEVSRSSTSAKATRNPVHQKRGYGCCSGMSLIVRVTDSIVWPGAISASSAPSRGAASRELMNRLPLPGDALSRDSSSGAGC